MVRNPSKHEQIQLAPELENSQQQAFSIRLISVF